MNSIAEVISLPPESEMSRFTQLQVVVLRPNSLYSHKVGIVKQRLMMILNISQF
jgi:hypothetical protein